MLFELMLGAADAGAGGGGGGGGDPWMASTPYTGSGAAAHAITNGVNLSGDGGAVWLKRLTATEDHAMWDSVRGLSRRMRLNSGVPGENIQGALSFKANGFILSGLLYNGGGAEYASWSFKRTTGLFSVVTFPNIFEISHGLGATPGFIMVCKRTGNVEPWSTREHTLVWHRDFLGLDALRLNAPGKTNAEVDQSYIHDVDGTSFQVADNSILGGGWQDTYVAYCFGHDSDKVYCGTYTGTKDAADATVQDVALPFAPSWIMILSGSPDYLNVIYDVVTNKVVPVNSTGQAFDTGVAFDSATLKVHNVSGQPTRKFAETGTQYYYVAVR